LFLVLPDVPFFPDSLSHGMEEGQSWKMDLVLNYNNEWAGEELRDIFGGVMGGSVRQEREGRIQGRA